jgi:acyl-CoA synthetase (AMP-forming)/AMP-acid ligase II
MAGYFEDAEATHAVRRGRWLRTFDLGSIDEQGHLRVQARRVDLILSGGENVYPREVEAVLEEHPHVREAAVLPEEDPTWGQVPVAWIAFQGAPPSMDALIQHCRARLASYKVPRRFIQVSALPRNAAGKIDRALLGSDFQDRATDHFAGRSLPESWSDVGPGRHLR